MPELSVFDEAPVLLLALVGGAACACAGLAYSGLGAGLAAGSAGVLAAYAGAAWLRP